MLGLSRRKFNNLLIFSILAFITIFHLAGKLKKPLDEHFKQDQQKNGSVIRLLPNQFSPSIFHFTHFSIQKINNQWQSDAQLTIPAKELVTRWLTLSGTKVDENLRNKLKHRLTKPFVLTIEQTNTQEPLRITYYQLSNFWLIQNWQSDWLAVSVESNYLLPLD